MEIIIDKKTVIRTISSWSCLIITIGSAITLIASIGLSMPLGRLFLATQLTVHLMMVPAVLTGYFAGYRLRNRNLSSIIIRIMPFTTLALTAGWAASYVLVQKVLHMVPDFYLFDSIIRIYIPSLALNIIFSIITPTVELLLRERNLLRHKADEAYSGSGRPGERFIMLRERGSLCRIAHDDISYLSSHGKKTLIHTREREYEIYQAISELESLLPRENFMRIHKQYIANILYISRLQYYRDGRYWAYLSDSDENTLPVGRKYAPSLKQRLEQ